MDFIADSMDFTTPAIDPVTYKTDHKYLDPVTYNTDHKYLHLIKLSTCTL